MALVSKMRAGLDEYGLAADSLAKAGTPRWRVSVATQDPALEKELAEMFAQESFDAFEWGESPRDARDLTALVLGQMADILLVDLYLAWEDRSAVQFVRPLVEGHPELAVVFVCEEERLLEAVEEVYYAPHAALVVRPLDELAFLHALQIAARQVERASLAPLAVRTHEGMRVIALDRVSYVKSDLKFLCFHVGDEEVRTVGKLAGLPYLLPSWFVRCHMSYVVNLSYITELRSGSLVLSTGEVLPVSRRRKQQVKAALESFVGRVV